MNLSLPDLILNRLNAVEYLTFISSSHDAIIVCKYSSKNPVNMPLV